MLDEFIERFCGKHQMHQKPQKTLPSAGTSAGEEQGPALSAHFTLGSHLYRQPGEVAEVIFTHKSKNIRKTIVDDYGHICDFPGFGEPEEIKKHLEDGNLPKPVIRFRTVFERESDGGFLMIWQVQPDGRYWEDEDGFGGTSDLEVCLYAHIDASGCFAEPFKLYSIGTKTLYHKG